MAKQADHSIVVCKEILGVGCGTEARTIDRRNTVLARPAVETRTAIGSRLLR